MKILILGLGNPILSDDGVGIYIARELEHKGKLELEHQDITVVESSMSGLTLLDILSGYDKAIIIDAIQTGRGKAGQIYRLDPSEFDNTRHASSPHDTNFATALELGRKLNIPLPGEIVIFAIEVADVSTFSEECTPEVRRAIPICAEMVMQQLEQVSSSTSCGKSS